MADVDDAMGWSQTGAEHLKVVIIGAGTVGLTLAEDFTRLRHSVSVVESRPELCQELATQLEVLTVPGEGASPSVLEAAGIKEADMLVAVTPSDQTNLLLCCFAKQYGVARRVARVTSEEFTSPHATIDLSAIGVTDVIEPEKEVVNTILQYLELPGLTETANFQSGSVYLRGYQVCEDMPLCNRTLAEMAQLCGSAPMLIVAIVRNGECVPATGAQTLVAGDEVVTIMPRESFAAYKGLLNRGTGKLKKVVLYGDSLTVVHLAEQAQRLAERVIVVDPDEVHARATAAALGKAEVLHGDCTDSDVLQEIHIGSADFFVAAGKDTEDNIMSCLLAKAEGACEVIAVNHSDRHADLFKSLGLDHIVNPRRVTAETIIDSILRLPIRAHLRLANAGMEVIRVTSERNSKVVGKPLRALRESLKASTVIGAVVRGEDVIVPQGSTSLLPGDEAIVLCQRENVRYVRRLFRAGLIPSPRGGSA